MSEAFDLDRLLEIARQDTGGSRRVAQFLLSLWDGDSYRADLQAIMYIDHDIFRSMLALWNHLHQTNQQLYSLIGEDEIRPVIAAWGKAFSVDRPHAV